MIIKHLCNSCNKEFTISQSDIDENNTGKFISIVICPYCQVQNHLWLKIENE